MTWLNPWAWVGLVALALPVLIHLLARGHARVEPFPSLRFLATSRLLPTRRTRVHEWLLLATRLAILAAAVAALARPLLLTSGRSQTLRGGLARAIVVDTSASMARRTSEGATALDAAMREARRLAGEAEMSVVLSSATPARMIAAATGWLSRQAGQRELVVISDLQLGAVTAVPTGFGVRVVRVAVASDTIVETRAETATGQLVARAAVSDSRTQAQWRDTSAIADSVMVLAATADLAASDAARRAARAAGTRLPLDSARAIAIVFPRSEQRAALLRSARIPREPWMTDAVVQMRRDSALIAAATGVATASVSDSAAGLVVARAVDGKPIVVARQGALGSRDRLLLFANVEPGTLVSAALIAASTAARSAAVPIGELEPGTLPESVVAAWQRPPSVSNVTAAAARDGMSDGRWLWVLVLALLMLETWLRRTRAVATPLPVTRDRAA